MGLSRRQKRQAKAATGAADAATGEGSQEPETGATEDGAEETGGTEEDDSTADGTEAGAPDGASSDADSDEETPEEEEAMAPLPPLPPQKTKRHTGRHIAQCLIRDGESVMKPGEYVTGIGPAELAKLEKSGHVVAEKV